MTIDPMKIFQSKGVSNDPQQNKIARQLWFYFVGSMFTQISTNAAQVTGPLVLLRISSSSFMTLIYGLSAGTDALGTLVGSIILKHCSPNVTLVVIHILRLICNFLLVLLLKLNKLNRTNGALLILADNFSLGMYDTVRALLPLVWTNNTDEKTNSIHQQLKQLNQRAQFMFELGTLLGPLLIGIILTSTKNNEEIAIWCTVVSFSITCFCYMFVPNKVSPVPKSKQNLKQTILEIIHSNDSTIKQCYFTMILLQIYRVKSSLPALIADSILHSPSVTAWITSMWGVSGMIGSMAFRKLKSNSLVTTLKYDALALFIFAFAWKTYNLYAYLMTVVFYITIDSIVRLQVQTLFQAEITIHSLDASIMSTNRFFCKINALLVRLAISACFYAPNINELQFWLTTAFFLLCSVIIYGLAYWFNKNSKLKTILNVPISKCLLDTTPHNYPGYLFVFEGLDGSGKSTQIMLLMQWLQQQYPNTKIHLTTWNSSLLLSNTIRNLKQQRLLKNPYSFALLQCTDLIERLNTLIVPALQNGDIVLCDRYCFTALARDKVRGCDINWETQLYQFHNNNKSILIWPDAILLFRVSVHVAIARVYARSLINVIQKRDLNDDENLHSDDENDLDDNQTEEEEEEEENLNDDPLFKQRINTTFRGSVSYDTIADDLLGDKSTDCISTQTNRRHSSRYDTVNSNCMSSVDQHNQTDEKSVPSSPSTVQISYYEAGLDLNFHSDLNINFHYFQHKVQTVYQELHDQYSFTNTFHLFNGELDRETLFQQIKQSIQNTIKQRQSRQMIPYEEPKIFTMSEHFNQNISINKNTNILQTPTNLPGQNNEILFRLYKKGSTLGAALHFYSRFLTLQLQERFINIWESLTNQSISNSNQIKSYLHGNPQLDNCVITMGQENGCFLLDFDRSRIGPISWDIMRFLLSIQIAFNTKFDNINEKENYSNSINYHQNNEKYEDLTILQIDTNLQVKDKQNHRKVNRFPIEWSKAFQQGYIDGINAQQHLQTLSFTLTKLINQKNQEKKIPNYLKSSRSQPILFDQIKDENSSSHYILQLLQQYLDSTSAQQAGLISDINQLSIIEIGRTYSTQHRERIIIIIKYQQKSYHLEFKLMLHDNDINGFIHPKPIDEFDDAQRFLLAAEFYLPNHSIHQLLYPTSCKGTNSSTYLAFIHQIQSIRKSTNDKTNYKFKFRGGITPRHMDSLQIQELLYALAHQLGYAHNKFIHSNQNQQNIKLSTYILANWTKIIQCVLQLQSEVIQSYQYFIKQQQFHLN